MTENDAIKKLKNLFSENCLNLPCTDSLEVLQTALVALHEIQQYRAIDTIEKFKSLKEKSVAKKPIRSDLCTCPSCGTHNDIIKKRRNTVTFDTVYCWHCGQAMEIRLQNHSRWQ